MYEYALTPSMSISFQRFPYPPTGLVTGLPTSRGALPLLHSAPGKLVLPCPQGEAFWIGLVPSGHAQNRLRVIVSLASEHRVDALTGAPADDIPPADANDLAAPRNGIPGIFRGDGSWWAFARDTGAMTAPACLEIELLCRSVGATEPFREPNDPGRQHAGPGHRDESDRPPAPESRPSVESPPDGGSSSSVEVDVVGPEDFHALSGMRVQPLEEANHYGGWRLP
ncbi:MAG: hypothetical protein K0S98_974 [Propionibacteriaceae bacterium]|nr:hypothetical protein [Propionibacteriaceae bacterium]